MHVREAVLVKMEAMVRSKWQRVKHIHCLPMVLKDEEDEHEPFIQKP